MKTVSVKQDIVYLKDAKGALHLDLYTPAGLKAGDKCPAIIFMNAIGDRPGARKIKSWGIYSSWPRLMAAHGYIGISMETDGARIQESIGALFNFIAKNGASYGVDPDKLGIYAASANVSGSAAYLMNEQSYPGVKAAVFYYGNPPSGPYRKDLPVLFVVSEGDAGPGRYNSLWTEVLKNKAPWTLRFGSGMPHGFDAYSDNDSARKIIKETISFWKDNLDPVPAPSWGYSKARDIIGSLQMNRSRAIDLLKSLADENPRDVSTLTFYGSSLRESNRLEEAETVFKRILSIDPKHREALVAMAVLAYKKNNAAEAEGYISKAVNAGVMNREGYSQLGFALLVADKNKESALWYEKAVALEPRGVDYYNLGCAYAKTNNAEKALPALEQAVKHGYSSKQQFESDGDLASLRSNDRFKDLLRKLK
jgi:tetratricopeptide (TPR) repeat protein